MSGYHRKDDDLAYGEDHQQQRGSNDQQSTDRSLFGDAFKKARSKYDQYSAPKPSGPDYGYSNPGTGQQQSQAQPWGQPPQTGTYQQYGNQQYSSNQPGQSPYPGGPPPQPSQPKPDLATKLLGGLHGAIHNIGTDVAGMLGTQYPGQHHSSSATAPAGTQTQQTAASGRNRFDSFATPAAYNQVKWYVDGCSYMWAVSQALENARQSIWILDWWLSPELYLRRPPAANEEWRLDRVLQRAAQRGVKVNIIVYKEVTQALTLSSHHTKHALEDLSPNIGVFRHPDHLPDAQTAQSSFISSFQNLKLDAASASKLGSDALKGIYGLNEGVILYWAHHEKLCLIDGQIAFMGGLDLCYGRWDTHQHSISDAHPSDLNKIIFPGQDFNNARVMDFDDVAHPFHDKVDRTKTSRMGWSDISICLRGPCVEDLRHHFTDRWNFIYDEKYNVRKDVRYQRLPQIGSHAAVEGAHGPQVTGNTPGQSSQYAPPPGSQSYQPPPWQATGSTGATLGAGVASANSRPHSPQPSSQAPPPPGQPPQPSLQQQQQQQQQPPQQPYGQPPNTSYNSDRPYGSYTQPPSQPANPTPPSQVGQGNYATYGQQPPSSTQTPPSNQGAYASHSQPPSELPIVPNSPPEGPATYETLGQQPPQTSYPPRPISAQQSQSYNQDSYSSAQPQSTSQEQAGQYSYNSYRPPPSPQPQPQQNYTSYQPSPSQQTSSQPPQGYPTYPEGARPASGQGYETYGQSPANLSTEPSGQQQNYNAYHRTEGTRGFDDDERGFNYEQERAHSPGYGRMDRYKVEGRRLGQELGTIGNMIQGKVEQKIPGNFFGSSSSSRPSSRNGPNMRCQVLRSCTKWSNGTPTEQSIQNAYIDIIQKSQHFVYIENQFFITATGDKQGPVKNQIGKAIVERILRAARENTPFKMIVIMPAIPAFAGDFMDNASLGTRAICEFQYFSICRGGHSIMEEISKAGVNPMDYIRFYNLRNYDRINYTPVQAQAQQQAGVSYEDARKQQEARLGAGYPGVPGQPQTAGQPYNSQGNPAQQYQAAAHNAPNTAADRWDSVASCYMLDGEDIRNVPWTGPPEHEIDAFVSEELYVHSKVIIADDQVVICGSANINDRSMLGYHDSEIALLIYDTTPQQSTMAGRPWQASRFAASLRRHLFR